jgi:hypothetical protein
VTDSAKAVFLSYASQDAEAALQLRDALRAAGIEVWLDQSELRGGDVWDLMIRQRIRDCALFVPVISENTASRLEGYFRADRWVPCKPGFFLSVRVLSRLFRRRFLEELENLHRVGELKFFGEHADLADAAAFADWLMPLRQCEWVVYAKRPFSGPEAVLAYLSRYTHRAAIANSRLMTLDDRGVTFRWKDYREHGRTRYKSMTLSTEEFMRRFLLHVLPSGFHRIRHYGLLANANRKTHIATARSISALLQDHRGHHELSPLTSQIFLLGVSSSGADTNAYCRFCASPSFLHGSSANARISPSGSFTPQRYGYRVDHGDRCLLHHSLRSNPHS